MWLCFGGIRTIAMEDSIQVPRVRIELDSSNEDPAGTHRSFSRFFGGFSSIGTFYSWFTGLQRSTEGPFHHGLHYHGEKGG